MGVWADSWSAISTIPHPPYLLKWPDPLPPFPKKRYPKNSNIFLISTNIIFQISTILDYAPRPSTSFSEENISKISPRISKISLISTNIILHISTILDYTPRPSASFSEENICQISKIIWNIWNIYKTLFSISTIPDYTPRPSIFFFSVALSFNLLKQPIIQ